MMGTKVTITVWPQPDDTLHIWKEIPPQVFGQNDHLCKNIEIRSDNSDTHHTQPENCLRTSPS
jgi:hypothetical protein